MTLLTLPLAPIFASKRQISIQRIEELQKIPTDSAEGIFAVEELLKVFYSNENWPQFFAYAQYYRNKWPVKERKQTQLLELLALLRHCQNENLQKLIHYYRTQTPENSETLLHIETLARTKFKKKADTQNQISPLSSHIKGEALWRISPENIELRDPQKLRIKVENKCSS